MKTFRNIVNILMLWLSWAHRKCSMRYSSVNFCVCWTILKIVAIKKYEKFISLTDSNKIENVRLN